MCVCVCVCVLIETILITLQNLTDKHVSTNKNSSMSNYKCVIKFHFHQNSILNIYEFPFFDLNQILSGHGNLYEKEMRKKTEKYRFWRRA